jgi:hypothetical protein
MNDDAPSLFDVALFLVCSSRLALDETLPYASMRLLDGAGRLLQADPGDDAFFAAMRGAVEETKVKVMHDLDFYTRALDELQERFVREAKARNSAAES